MKFTFTKTFTALVALMIFSSMAFAQTVYYYEDFDGSQGDWTTNWIAPDSTAVFIWQENGSVANGAFAGAGDVLDSDTDENGAMVMNYDFVQTGGVAANAPEFPYTDFVTELISPSIDMSDVPGAVSLSFWQYFRRLNPDPNRPFASVETSIDGGLTWSDPTDCNPAVAANDDAINTQVVIPLPDVQGNADVRIKFVYAGDFYFWAIDDIRVVERPFNNMRVNDNFYAIAPNFMTPASQVENFGFLADIENIGGNDQSGVELAATITDGAGAVIHTDLNDYGMIGVDSLAENVSFGAFTPPAVVGSYGGNYTITADSADVDPTDNSIDWSFMVSDSVFAKENGVTRTIYPGEGNWDAGENRSWAYGNHFHIVNDIYANTVTFSIEPDATATGEAVSVILYSWVDDNADGDADPTERTLAAFTTYTIAGNEVSTTPITVTLADLIGNSPLLTAGMDYILTLEFNASDDVMRCDFGASGDFDYGAMTLNSEQQGAPRYGSFLGINGDLTTEPYSSNGFGTNFQPFVRMNVNAEQLLNSTKDILSDANEVSVFPNPVNAELNITINLEEAADEVFVNVLDVTGKLVQAFSLTNWKEGQTQINTSRLSAGTYFVQIVTNQGTKATQFVKK